MKPLPAMLALLALWALPLAGPQAQQQAPGDKERTDGMGMESLVVVGSRREARSVFDSPSPVDIHDGEDFRNQGGTDMAELLRSLAPSFNVNTQPVSDASTFIRPVNLRGLAPDHALALVNGKRRHRAAAIGWLTHGVSDGAQGPDISVIPAIAVKQVEMLRDGASAQYGSDAIAGVLNFVLKDASSGGSFEIKSGEYDEGGEEDWVIAANIGFPFTDKGFFNLSLEYGESEETFRAVQRADAQALIDAGNSAVPSPAQNWGNPRISPNFKGFFNLGLALDDNREAYAFGNYAQKESEGSFYFRHPDTRGGIYGVPVVEYGADGMPVRDMDGKTVPVKDADGKQLHNRLVADLGIVEGVSCAQPARAPKGHEMGLVVGDEADEQLLQEYLANETARGRNCFVFNERFPGGFTPRFGSDLVDFSLVAGLRGALASGMDYDLSLGFGQSDADFFIFNTLNGSLGPDSPTSFDPGDYTQTEYNFNADFIYPLAIQAFASDLNIAWGAEYRIEAFEITAGQEASWQEGPYAEAGFSLGSNGFPGFPASIAGDWSRANSAVYLDLEADITGKWLLGMAARFEDFEDFGATTNGKVSTLISFTDSFGLRATYSTGFRAPTPGQQNASNTTSAFDAEAGDIIHRGAIPSNSPIAQQRGGEALAEEKSTSLTAGLVFEWERLNISLDYYRIDIEDRIALTQDFTLDDEERDKLVAAGVPNARDIEDFRFFQNAFDTETTGLDLVASYSWQWQDGAMTDISLAWNDNQSEVARPSQQDISLCQAEPDKQKCVVGEQRVRELEESLPDSRYRLTLNHKADVWSLLLRYNAVDGWYDEEDDANTDEFDGRYDGYATLDMEIAIDLGNRLTLAFGGQNVTDEYPEKHPFATTTLGNQYSQFAPLGFNGAFHYARAVYDF